MFENRFIEGDWKNLGNIGSKWKLINFSERNPPTWESYWKDEREYWDADREDKSRVEHYFGKENTEENLLKKCRKGYKNFTDHLKKWNGLCKVGEIVDIIRLESNIIALSKNWSGEVKDHDDLVIRLLNEKTFYGKHVQFRCKILSYGTIVVPKGSLPNQMGEPAGSSRTTHSHGNTKYHREPVHLENHIIKINDASFSILSTIK